MSDRPLDRVAPPAAAAAPASAPSPAERDEPALRGHLVALLFAAEEPLSLGQAARILEVPLPVLEAVAAALEAEPPPGLMVQRLGDALRLVTAPASARYVERLLGGPPVARLSRAAQEVLAIVAYRQPITRAEIEALRGVNSERALEALLARGLVAAVGRKETVGRPALFGTTAAFLDYLGLRSLAELPPLPPAPEPA
ncbi:MAG TPA: SMC-Scp complex subunit ScpB [Chloroflexota bacterium]|nr:SMC-Scp complex subunit ScpB [Chloroflexota bacterium]